MIQSAAENKREHGVYLGCVCTYIVRLKPLRSPQSCAALRVGWQRLDQRGQREELPKPAPNDPTHHQPHTVVRKVSSPPGPFIYMIKLLDLCLT